MNSLLAEKPESDDSRGAMWPNKKWGTESMEYKPSATRRGACLRRMQFDDGVSAAEQFADQQFIAFDSAYPVPSTLNEGRGTRIFAGCVPP